MAHSESFAAHTRTKRKKKCALLFRLAFLLFFLLLRLCLINGRRVHERNFILILYKNDIIINHRFETVTNIAFTFLDNSKLEHFVSKNCKMYEYSIPICKKYFAGITIKCSSQKIIEKISLISMTYLLASRVSRSQAP